MQIHPGLASRCMEGYVFSPQMGPESVVPELWEVGVSVHGKGSSGSRSLATMKLYFPGSWCQKGSQGDGLWTSRWKGL